MRRLKTIVAALALIGFSVWAEAHAMLDHASPAVGSTISTPPGQVTLYFTEQLEPKFSGAEVRKGGGRQSRRSWCQCERQSDASQRRVAGRWHLYRHVARSFGRYAQTQGSFSFTVGK